MITIVIIITIIIIIIIIVIVIIIITKITTTIISVEAVIARFDCCRRTCARTAQYKSGIGVVLYYGRLGWEFVEPVRGVKFCLVLKTFGT